MAIGRFGGSDRRRSPRYNKRFRVLLYHDGRSHEIRTIDISEHGVLIPRRLPPPIGTNVKLSITIREENSEFEGIVVRHAKCLVNSVQAIGIGIDFSTPEYREFVRDKISIA